MPGKFLLMAAVLPTVLSLATGKAAQSPLPATRFDCGVPARIKPAPARAADLPAVSPKSGKLRAKVFRVSFPDIANDLSAQSINAVAAEVNRFYRDVSRSAFQWEFSIHEEIWMAPKVSTTYDNSNGTAIFDLADFIEKKNKAVGGYDVSISNFPRVKNWDGTFIPWLKATFVNGKFDTAVISHELGHYLDLDHANGIDAGTEVFGSIGNEAHHDEYGNPFDNMGFTPSFAHFHVQSKWRLGWLSAAEIKEIKTTGVYRIYAHDHPAHKDRLVGIRVPTNNGKNGYWVEYRSTNAKARTGASILFDYYRPDFDGLHLLDMTPGTLADNAYHDDVSDGMLVPGKAYKDKLASLNFRTVAINSGVWDQNAYVDVEVTVPGSSSILAFSRDPASAGFRRWAGRDALIDLNGRILNPRAGGPSRNAWFSREPLSISQ
jgi:hypothetical protein